jgi:hypothetical protein
MDSSSSDEDILYLTRLRNLLVDYLPQSWMAVTDGSGRSRASWIKSDRIRFDSTGRRDQRWDGDGQGDGDGDGGAILCADSGHGRGQPAVAWRRSRLSV